MDNIIVTIARQYGSGGKTVGQMLADKMGINCYEREIIRMASIDSGISEALFAKNDERIGTSSFHRFKDIYTGGLIPPESDGFVSDKNLFNYQAKVIKDLAKDQSCVIIGRCADFILKDYPNVVSVFVHASPEYCKASAMKRMSISEKDVAKFIEKTDKYRGDYYKHFTGREWYDLRNYDLVINSEKLGYEKSVDAILRYIDTRFNK